MRAIEHRLGKTVCSVLLLAGGIFAGPLAWSSDRISVTDIFELEFAFDPQDLTQCESDCLYATVCRHNDGYPLLEPVDDRCGREQSSGTHDRPPQGQRCALVSGWRAYRLCIRSRWQHTDLCRHLRQGPDARITNLPRPPGFLAWSPDGESIAFVSVVVDPPLRIVELPPAPPGAQWKKERSRLYDRLVYRREQLGYVEGDTHAFVVPAEGGTPRQITHGPFNHGKVGGPCTKVRRP